MTVVHFSVRRVLLLLALQLRIYDVDDDGGGGISKHHPYPDDHHNKDTRASYHQMRHCFDAKHYDFQYSYNIIFGQHVRGGHDDIQGI